MYRDRERYGQDPAKVERAKSTWGLPRKLEREALRTGRTPLVFLASWSDFFHHEADEWRSEAWAQIRQTPHVTYQILTKRPSLIASRLPKDWGVGYSNVWLGTTAEDRTWWDRRIPILRGIPAAVHFVSYEPALGSIVGADASGIDWVIIGGESGPKARDFRSDWAHEAIAVAREAGAAPFVKQLGQVCDGVRARDARGDWTTWDPALRVREFPAGFVRTTKRALPVVQL